jgi:hypothetical protein
MLAYLASGWFMPFSRTRLRQQRRDWLCLAAACSRQAFAGGPGAKLLRRDLNRVLVSVPVETAVSDGALFFSDSC